MKILIGGSTSKIFHLKEFADALEKIQIKQKTTKPKTPKTPKPTKPFKIEFINSSNLNLK